MAIIDKTKAVVENFKEEFSVSGAIELIEGLGYKVYKEIPLKEAKDILNTNGYTILDEEQIEKMDTMVTEKLAQKTDLNFVLSEAKENGYTVLSEAELDLIDEEIKTIKDDSFKEGVKEGSKEVLRMIQEKEEIIESEFIEKLKEKNYVVLDEEEANLVDEEMKRIIEEEVILKLREDTNIEDPEKNPKGDNENPDLVDDIKDDDGDDDADESKKSGKKENKLTLNRKKPLFEKLVLGDTRKFESTEEENSFDAVAGVAKNIENGESDLTGEGDSDVADVAQNIDDEEIGEHKKGIKKLKLESLIR